jgi:hypothetical protein
MRKDKTMFAFLFALAEVVQSAIANNPGAVAAAATAVALTGSALVALMRKHRAKNKELAEQLGISGKEVTQARKSGIDDPDQAARWQNAITSRPIPERRSRRRRKNRQAEQQGATNQETPATGPESQSDPNYQPQTPLPQKLLLPANLAVLVKAAAREQHCRFGATTGIRLTATRDGYQAEATNGRILARVKGAMPFDPQDYPDVPALQSAPQGETVGTIPAEVWSKAFKGVPRRPVKPVLGTVAAVLGKDQATLVSTDLENANVQSPRLVEGRWPNTDQVFPKGKPRFTINVDAKLLIDLLQVATAFSSQDHNNKVTMEFHDRNQPFAIRTRSDDGQEFSGLIVPLVGTEEAQQPREQPQAQAA